MNAETMEMEKTSEAVTREKLAEDLRVVVADAEELLRATANQAGEKAAAARERIQESLRVAKDRLAATSTILAERSRQAAKVTDEYVHENPWKAIGVAACVGVIVGMLISRR